MDLVARDRWHCILLVLVWLRPVWYWIVAEGIYVSTRQSYSRESGARSGIIHLTMTVNTV